MKIYKVGQRDVFDQHQGYTWHTNKQEAIKAWKQSDKEPEETDFEELEIKLDKKSILIFLNIHCSHPDNG
jgi:hypothetical protein